MHSSNDLSVTVNAPNSISAGASPQTLLGSLQRSPDLLVWLRGPTPTSKGREEKGKGERGKGRERERKRGVLDLSLKYMVTLQQQHHKTNMIVICYTESEVVAEGLWKTSLITSVDKPGKLENINNPESCESVSVDDVPLLINTGTAPFSTTCFNHTHVTCIYSSNFNSHLSSK